MYRAPIRGCGPGAAGPFGVALGPGARHTVQIGLLRARPLARLVLTGIATPSLRESVREAA